MNRRILCLILSITLVFTAFIPFVHAEYIIMYSTDGRTVHINKDDLASWRNAGWFETPHDAEIITMYSMDGRTIDIPQYYRQDYLNVGWYNSYEDVTQTMYSMDGRSIVIYKTFAEAYRQVGWYYNLSDVSVKMYDTEGNEYTVFKDNIEREKANGLTLNKNDVLQLMFSADGRFIYVPFKDVEAYNAVGWYTAGRKLDPTKPMVALTFDDGPGPYTERVLSILEKYNSRATFFVQGKNVSGYAQTVKRAVENGNEIGNHTWNHVYLTKSSYSTISSQISSTNQAVYNVTGKYPALYRPPYGAYNDSVLSSIPMPAIMWSVDTLDWKTRNASKTLQSVQSSTKDGSIILMHDIHEPTADAVEPVVKWLLMNGYQLVTVSELIWARSGNAVNGKTYNRLAP